MTQHFFVAVTEKEKGSTYFADQNFLYSAGQINKLITGKKYPKKGSLDLKIYQWNKYHFLFFDFSNKLTIGYLKLLPIPIYNRRYTSDMLNYGRYRYFLDSKRTSCTNR